MESQCQKKVWVKLFTHRSICSWDEMLISRSDFWIISAFTKSAFWHKSLNSLFRLKNSDSSPLTLLECDSSLLVEELQLNWICKGACSLNLVKILIINLDIITKSLDLVINSQRHSYLLVHYMYNHLRVHLNDDR
jgi:hypothetical protein